MRYLTAMALLLCSVVPALANRPAAGPFVSLQSTVAWIDQYRATRDLQNAPTAARALSFYNGLKDPDATGVYVGFIAGIIGSNPDEAERMIERMLPLRDIDQWALVRGIAYSGHPRWKWLLRAYAPRMPMWRAMIDKYVEGRAPLLRDLAITPNQTLWQRTKNAVSIDFGADNKSKRPVLEPTQPVLDTLWGYYLASGSYGPVLRIVEMLPWSRDRDNADRLTVGSMAKYTLALNAARDPALLAMLRNIRKSKNQPNETASLLAEVIDAAETADTARLRKNALAAIEEVKTKGPAYKRDISTWNKIGQGAIAAGCVAAAVAGQFAFGIPCVVGGGAMSAAGYYMSGN